MKAPTILKSFLLRKAPAAVVPLPEKTRFERELTAELDTLGGEIGLAQFLDAAIKTQKIALDSLVNISYRDDSDRGDVNKYLEDNVEFLDVCNYFVEKIENIYNYLDKLKVVVHLVDNSCSPLKPNNVATARAMELLNSSSCKIVVEKRSSNGLKKLLRQKLCHDETEMSEIMCGSKAMTLMCLRFLELGLSFDSKSVMLPKMKLSQPSSSSWLRLLNELAKQVEASVDEKTPQENRLSLLQQTVDAARELKQQMKREKEMKCCVERLKKKCKELEDVVDVIEERVKDLYKCLIDVRMTLLGILSQH